MQSHAGKTTVEMEEPNRGMQIVKEKEPARVKNEERGESKKKEPFSAADSQEDILFDLLLEEIGNDGKFQKRLNFIYNFLYVIILAMPYLNIVLAMTVPDHWCHVPGLEETNYTAQEWKEKWLPKSNKSSGEPGYSSCEMFAENGTEMAIVGCKHGWDFDRHWYKETVPTQENWVCEKEIYVSNIFAAGRIGEILGTMVFGQMGDRYGRKPVFYISLIVMIVGRILSVFTSGSYHLFLFANAVGSLSSLSVYQSPLVISMEVSDEKRRSHITFLQCTGWVVGLCLMAFIAWGLNEWKIFMLVTTLPNVVCFFTYKLLPESPRWLASRGNVEQAYRVLKYIAKVNNSKVPDHAYAVLEKIKNKKEKIYGFASAFSNWRLTKNTIMITISWTICGLGYYIITLSVTSMSGNPFMNFFWQSLVELPGYFLGKILSDKFGRRWSHTGSFVIAIFFSAGIILVQTLNLPNLIIVMTTFLKLALTTSFYIIWLRAMEIYPTCIRQTGISIGSTIANIIGVTGSYVVYLGTTVDQRLPFVILTGIILSGCLSASFLPETLHKKLPETLEDAKIFGKNQKYWSLS